MIEHRLDINMKHQLLTAQVCNRSAPKNIIYLDVRTSRGMNRHAENASPQMVLTQHSSAFKCQKFKCHLIRFDEATVVMRQ